jgi:two-component system, LytTR family, response regulator LytT
MKVLIFEDEKHTALRLKSLLTEIDNSINVIDIICSVEAGIKWFKDNEMPDLVFQDIILSDGNCFDVFNAIKVTSPVIFTTAFSDYALQSFRVNSIDYIVKPYDIKDIQAALKKLSDFKQAFLLPENKLLKEVINEKKLIPKKRFLIKSGENFTSISSSDIAYLVSDNGLTFATLFNGKKYIVDYSILDLSTQMDRSYFFQINRKMIVNIDSVKKINSWFNGRLKIQIDPPLINEITVSRERVKSFKEWLDS